ncbi:hypothetical protein Q5P01_008701 [Channa striata]|uniref:Uncharacterized protein n=1 Tax=Channa striata TaxID=64152 RepID=A0AA88SSY1_CHASR|nr:hypothetical protein Q5P01_008701 [Channa striata]
MHEQQVYMAVCLAEPRPGWNVTGAEYRSAESSGVFPVMFQLLKCNYDSPKHMDERPFAGC